jgi:hypothetical protein
MAAKALDAQGAFSWLHHRDKDFFGGNAWKCNNVANVANLAESANLCLSPIS